MGLRARLSRLGGVLGGEAHADGEAELHLGDARYDDWAVIRDFSELEAARTWRQMLGERGIDSVLTADWPLDEFGRGDIALRVLPRDAVEAEERVSDPE